MDDCRPSGFLLNPTQWDLFSKPEDAYLPNEVMGITWHWDEFYKTTSALK